MMIATCPCFSASYGSSTWVRVGSEVAQSGGMDVWPVMGEMFSARHYFEVVWRVIEFVSVFVMNHFVVRQFAAKQALHDDAVFSLSAARHVAETVYGPRATYAPDTFQRVSMAIPRVVVVDAVSAATRRFRAAFY